MTGPRPSLWTLDELCDRAAQALAVDYAGQASGRIRDLPDRRTVRFYTTHGLVDRPASYRGRTALYGARHLLQVVAIKRLQTTGLTLAEVQARLLGRTDADLEKIARLSEETETAATDNAFWKREPAPPSPPLTADAEAAVSLLAVPLADGATLLLHAARTADPHDVEALRTAAAPLLRLLRQRRLIAEGTDTSHEGKP
jgi:DNA-binding transcriptional MerR regulator